jgi:hypothetical protein
MHNYQVACVSLYSCLFLIFLIYEETKLKYVKIRSRCSVPFTSRLWTPMNIHMGNFFLGLPRAINCFELWVAQFARYSLAHESQLFLSSDVNIAWGFSRGMWAAGSYRDFRYIIYRVFHPLPERGIEIARLWPHWKDVRALRNPRRCDAALTGIEAQQAG